MKITLFNEHNPPKNQKDVTTDTISGNPEQFVELMYLGQGETMKSGIWECHAGTFKASYDGIVEFCHILEGSAVINASDGQSVTVTAGDAFVLDEGLQAEWTVDKFIKKHFFICAANVGS